MKQTTKSKVVLDEAAVVPPRHIPERGEGDLKLIDRRKRSIISDFDAESQGTIDFGQLSLEEKEALRKRNSEDDSEASEKPEKTLQKVKHMQNILKKEGLSNKTMKENIDTFEDVPAYIRKNILMAKNENKTESKLSRFTLSSDEEEGPVLRENNAYLNDNVD